MPNRVFCGGVPDRVYLCVKTHNALIVMGHIRLLQRRARLTRTCTLEYDKKNCDAGYGDNYRSIALSSILLKIFDWIAILLFGKSLGMDDLQFSYQKDCSTTICTWLVVESVSYFLRNGNEVFSCYMDMEKALIWSNIDCYLKCS